MVIDCAKWLALGAVLWASAAAAQPPGQQPPSPPGRAQPAAPQGPQANAPDEELIEFLGEDDHGDAAWWEMLKRASPGAQNPPAAPPQGTKQS
jgi:hypothetical protein